MPLIDLKSNLTNLKFGNDRPGYGSSGLPYIQTRIPGIVDAAGNENPIFRIQSTGNLDYPIRGGEINFNLGSQTFTLSNKIDSIRIKKFFEDAPRGTAFIQKQIGLQLSNPKMETGNTLFGFGQSVPVPGLLENTRIYNKGQNTLAQVAASGTGAHAIRHGILPFNPLQKNYYDIVNAQNINRDANINRLVILSRLKITNSKDPLLSNESVIDLDKVNTLGISLNKNVLFQYLGGPGSVYGIGSTTIRRVVDTTNIKTVSGVYTMTYDQIKSQEVNNITDGVATTKIQDFRDQISGLKGKYTPWGDKTIDRFYVSSGISGSYKYQDLMNKSKAFEFNNIQAPWETGNNSDGSYNDLIKFVFELIDNDNTTKSIALFFRALLTNGITDNNTANYNGFKYIGRAENFYTYQGFERSISFGFKIAAQSKDELMPLYKKLNLLINQTYPDYSTRGIMRAPLVRLTIGDYLYRVPGIIDSVNITVENNASWELNLEGTKYIGLASDVAQLPKVLDVTVAFKPIMDTLQNRYGTAIVNDPKEVDRNTKDYATTLLTNLRSFQF